MNHDRKPTWTRAAMDQIEAAVEALEELETSQFLKVRWVHDYLSRVGDWDRERRGDDVQVG